MRPYAAQMARRSRRMLRGRAHLRQFSAAPTLLELLFSGRKRLGRPRA